jgi:hypothetical protein
VRPITVPVEEELETGEPIPDEEESVPVAKKTPALRGKVETRPTEQAKPARSSCSAKPNSPNESGGAQVVLASAKYLKSQPPKSTNRQSDEDANPESERQRKSFGARLGSRVAVLALIVAISTEITGVSDSTAVILVWGGAIASFLIWR